MTPTDLRPALKQLKLSGMLATMDLRLQEAETQHLGVPRVPGAPLSGRTRATGPADLGAARGRRPLRTGDHVDRV